MINQMVKVKWRYYAIIINNETKNNNNKYENIENNYENMNTI